jgi:ABC-type transport system substrate-binding protein
VPLAAACGRGATMTLPAGTSAVREVRRVIVGGARRVAALAVLLPVLLTALLAACTTEPAPPPAPPPPTAPPQPSQVVVAVDDLGPGFNPHLLAHQSPVTTALASLVLPSVFRPDASGALRLDPTVATSADVISTEPF